MRLAPLYEIVRSGAADADIRDLLDQHEERRWQTLRTFVTIIGDEAASHLADNEAADYLYALLSHEVYWLLVQRRGWSPDRWRRHVTAEAEAQLVPAKTNLAGA